MYRLTPTCPCCYNRARLSHAARACTACAAPDRHLSVPVRVQPRGVSKFCTLYALAKQGKNLEAFKLARYALDKIQQLKVPLRFQVRIRRYSSE